MGTPQEGTPNFGNPPYNPCVIPILVYEVIVQQSLDVLHQASAAGLCLDMRKGVYRVAVKELKLSYHNGYI